MPVEGLWGWLGAWVSCSPIPNNLSQLSLLLPEHLLPKAALVTSTLSGSALVWTTPHHTGNQVRVSLLLGPMPPAGLAQAPRRT